MYGENIWKKLLDCIDLMFFLLKALTVPWETITATAI